MRLLDRLLGTVTARVTGAQPEDFLNRCVREGVRLQRMEPLDATSLEAAVSARFFRRMTAAAERSQCEVSQVRKRGLPFFLLGFRKRYTLLAGGLLTALAVLFGGQVVLTVEVSGNVDIPDQVILSNLRLCGVGTGTWGPSVPIRAVENEMMQAMDGLSFFSLNLRGTKAEVIVRERDPGPAVTDETQPADIIAVADGILTHIEPWRGDAQFVEGDPIQAGDVLISGRTTLDYSYLTAGTEYQPETKLVHAQGRASARTWRTLTARMDLAPAGKVYTGEETTRRSLSVFGWRINFSKNSSVEYPNCDIIERFKTWEPLEGRVLPVIWHTETYRAYEYGAAAIDPAQAEARCRQVLTEALAELVNGEVLQTDFTVETTEEAVTVTLLAQCQEEVGRTVPMDTDERATTPAHPQPWTYGAAQDDT